MRHSPSSPYYVAAAMQQAATAVLQPVGQWTWLPPVSSAITAASLPPLPTSPGSKQEAATLPPPFLPFPAAHCSLDHSLSQIRCMCERGAREREREERKKKRGGLARPE
uniref:Uncharacterized protein n=1 Tax=Micrurus corallinus TaxID=54390 RepID=A0A2D4GK56_MICCO